MKKSLKDNELENVTGGNYKENNELRDAFNRKVSVEKLKLILKRHGITADIYDDQRHHNGYIDNSTGKTLKHEEVIELIKKNHWH